jgi:hypothetical protein
VGYAHPVKPFVNFLSKAEFGRPRRTIRHSFARTDDHAEKARNRCSFSGLATPERIEGPCVILSVDAVAFRPVVTIPENGAIDELKDFDQFESPNLFSQDSTGEK